MTQPQYALSWDSYKTNICSGFSSLQQNGEFVDMTIAADGHLVKVHQVLVALASPFLKDLIASAPCQHPVIFLNNVSHKVLSYLLEYIYTGEAIVPSDNLPGFMEAAKSLHIKGLEGISDDHSFAGNDEMYSIVNQNDSEAVPKLRGAKRKATSISDTLDTPMEEQPVSGDEFEDSGPPEDIKDSTVRLQEDLKETYYQPVKKRPVSRNDDEDNSQPEVTENSTVRLQEDFKEIKAHVVTDTFTEIIPYKADSRWFSRGGEFYVVKRSRKDCLTLRCADFRCPVQWNLRAGKAGPVKGQHNHCPTPWVPNRNAMFQSLKERSMQENIPLKEIYDEEAAKYNLEKNGHDKKVALPRTAKKIVVMSENSLQKSQECNKSMKSESDISHDFSDLVYTGTEDSDDGIKLEEITTEAETEKVKSATSNLLFTVSIRGSLQVILNRYIYNLNSTTTKRGLRRWRCVDYRDNKCSAFLITKGNVVINRANPHTHPFHDKKILAKIEKKAVFSALDDVEAYRGKEKELDQQDRIDDSHFDE